MHLRRGRATWRHVITSHLANRAWSIETLEARQLLSAASPVSIADPATVNGAYVQAVYESALGHSANPASQASWVELLDAGQPRLLLTNAIVNSDEHLSQFIRSAYEQYLGRAPEQPAIQYWLDQMHAGARDEDVEAALLASDEFYSDAGGTQNSWIQAAYQVVLGRSPDPAAAAWATSQLDAGTSRGRLATTLTMSQEREAQFVENDYAQALRLPSDPAAPNLFGPELAAGQLSQEQLTADLMAAAEYYEAHTGVPVTLVPVPNILPWAPGDFTQISSQAAQGNANVLFLGDSITQSWLGKGGEATWSQDFAPLGSLNAGVAGDTTENVLWRLEQGNLNGISPKLAVVMIGINDLGEGASPSDVAAGITAVVQTLRSEFPTTKILLLGLLPGLQVAPDSVFRQEIAAVNQLIEPLADAQNVWFLDLTPYFVNADGSTNQSLYLADHTHPDAAGYQVMAQAIAPWVRLLSMS